MIRLGTADTPASTCSLRPESAKSDCHHVEKALLNTTVQQRTTAKLSARRGGGATLRRCWPPVAIRAGDDLGNAALRQESSEQNICVFLRCWFVDLLAGTLSVSATMIISAYW